MRKPTWLKALATGDFGYLLEMSVIATVLGVPLLALMLLFMLLL